MRSIRPSRRPITPAQIVRLGLDTSQTIAVLTIVGLFACGSLMPMQEDSWQHLRCGEMIWQSGVIPESSALSFTLSGAGRASQPWLAQVGFFGLYSLGGLPLLNLLGGLVVAAAGVLLLAAMRGPMERRFVLLMLALPWMIGSLAVRPQIFTLLGLAMTLACLGRRRYWPLPLIFLVWANLHGGVAIGGVILVVATIVQLSVAPLRAVPLVIATCLAGAATLLTPMGYDLLFYPFDALARLRLLGLAAWMPPGLRDGSDVGFWLLCTAFLTIAAWRGPRVRRASTAQLIAGAGVLAILAAMSAQVIPLFLLAAAVAVSRLFPIHADVQNDRPVRRNLAVAGIFTAAAAAALAAALSAPLRRLDWQPFRSAAIDAIRAAPGPMFNSYTSGGYLLWFVPERRIFVDSRVDAYPLDLLLDATTTQRTGDPGTLFDRYRLRSALVERQGPLARTLCELGWAVCYADDRWVVLTMDGEDQRIAASR